jgi:D-serine deaminase-like pyridoxal phosphate-dependent protein
MSIFDRIQKPTLLLNESAARHNIRQMVEKTRGQHIRFRPHFKTHQSLEIGEWFREESVTAITVSSLDMAEYFSAKGWSDITVAFPVNLREIDTINRLASQVHLGLLVESLASIQFLQANLSRRVDIWVKVNIGANRTGLPWDQPEAILEIAKQAASSTFTPFRGLLTHAGHTYAARGAEAVLPIYIESVNRMNTVRDALLATGFSTCEVSVGDTPGSVLSPDLGQVDEIRPGNFVFFDAHQLIQEVCQPQDVAVALACPVVAKHSERCEIVIYGGAIHLSKDFHDDGQHRIYGLVTRPEENGWSAPIPEAYVRTLSQEHGIVSVNGPTFDSIQIGDLLCILPAHSCLTVQVMRRYLTLDGKTIETLNQ